MLFVLFVLLVCPYNLCASLLANLLSLLYPLMRAVMSAPRRHLALDYLTSRSTRMQSTIPYHTITYLTIPTPPLQTCTHALFF